MKTLVMRTAVVVALFGLFSFGIVPTSIAQIRRPYRYGDSYVRQIIQRLETRTDRFSNLLPRALDRSRLNGSEREDLVNTQVTNFEHATNALKTRFDSYQSTTIDAENVLREGARIDSFMRNHRLDVRTERAWTLVRTELNRLANAYSVASNWRNRRWPGPIAGYDAIFTGTYRLNSAISDNATTRAESATRNFSAGDRQRVFQNLINRLTPPEMIAIERHGNSVMLASTRTPQVSFVVDGIERIETYPDGRTSHVRATFSAAELKIVSNGNRASDFTATFVPTNDGRQLLVTREIYSERLATPVLVQSSYDRISEIARWSVYNGGSTPSRSSANFLIPDGTRLGAQLNKHLSTRYTRDGDPFTLRVTSPALYQGAMIEGHVSGVTRSGRLSGRSEMTLNFDRIRLANGQTFSFAGVVEHIETRNSENVLVDNEGAVSDADNRTHTTIERSGIGAAVGALIGAIAGGGKGAAIGAVLGAGTGAGSVYVQGRDELDLASGTDVTIRASSPAGLARGNGS